MITSFAELRAAAQQLHGLSVVVAAPYTPEILSALREAETVLGVRCVLVGEPGRMDPAWDPERMVPATGPADVLRIALGMVREGRGDILMKGSVDTAALMRAVLDEESGLRTGRLLSDVVAVEYGHTPDTRLVLITDGGVTTTPDLKAKKELILNAVEVAHALGIATPRVAVLSATEYVNPGLPSTLDAAALAKMNDRGQITGCLVDGPLALDNALSPEAAREKGLRSAVAGAADVLVAHSIEVANSLAKSITYFAGQPLAHVIVGARVPVLIPSRADHADARVLSMALGMLMNANARTREGSGRQ
jgi:phosphate butyryltransferase